MGCNSVGVLGAILVEEKVQRWTGYFEEFLNVDERKGAEILILDMEVRATKV